MITTSLMKCPDPECQAKIDKQLAKEKKFRDEMKVAASKALAALPQLADVEGPIVLIVTGRNIDENLWRRAIEHPESFPD